MKERAQAMPEGDDAGRKRGLGRGLSALLGEDTTEFSALDRVRSSKTVPIEFLQTGKFQPRRRFDDAQMQELIESVRSKGVLQPILVRRHSESPNAYEIVAGERRWRAAQAAGLREVPVLIRDMADRDALEVALIENLQRSDLTAVEEAEGYARLMVEFGHTQEALAESIGRSRSHVANTLRLLNLPEAVKEMLQSGELTAGHARALIGTPNPAELAKQVVARGLNVRQTERLAQPAAKKSGTAAPHKDSDTIALERDLSNLLGLKVTFALGKKGESGALTIHYNTLEQLDDILQRLRQAGPAIAAAADQGVAVAEQSVESPADTAMDELVLSEDMVATTADPITATSDEELSAPETEPPENAEVPSVAAEPATEAVAAPPVVTEPAAESVAAEPRAKPAPEVSIRPVGLVKSASVATASPAPGRTEAAPATAAMQAAPAANSKAVAN
jgi:ParB family transcriptional regulator, chromosome partitioning protein